MSKQIDWTKPLSDADREWASQFSIHHPLIELNDQQHAGKGDDESLAGAAEEEVLPYDQWKVEDLKAEADNRQLTYTSKVTKPELVAMLEADDAAEESPAT